MARRTGVFLLSLLLATPLAAQQDGGLGPGDEPVIRPELERREIEEPRIDADNIELGAFAGILSVEDFGVNAFFGARAAYHVTEDLFFELSAGTSKTDETSFERLSGGATLLADDERRFTIYTVAAGYNLLPGESFIGPWLAFNSSLFVVAGAGATEFAGERRFTGTFGAGYQVLPLDWLSLRVDFRDHLLNVDVTGEDKTTHNLEVTAGVTVFF